MSPQPESYIKHLRDVGYHPRSNKHSNALCLDIVHSLFDSCECIRESARNGNLVYSLNYNTQAGHMGSNIDLVLGQPASPSPPNDNGITEAVPALIQIAIELKSLMTEHGKQKKNRKRDLEAHHEHVHKVNSSAIAGAVFVINVASRFRSPLRRGDVTEHPPAEKLLTMCLSELRSLSKRSSSDGSGLDAYCAMVVEMDNIDLLSTRYADHKLVPKIGDPLHFDTFIAEVCQAYRTRFT